MSKDYTITFEQVDFRSWCLKYSDSAGEAEAVFEESAVPEYDWISDEPSFDLPQKRLTEVLINIQEWAAEQNIILKVWREDELGVSFNK